MLAVNLCLIGPSILTICRHSSSWFRGTQHEVLRGALDFLKKSKLCYKKVSRPEEV